MGTGSLEGIDDSKGEESQEGYGKNEKEEEEA